MTKCGDSNEWVSAALHASIAASYSLSIAFEGTLIDRIARRYRRWFAYPVATLYHARSTIEHLQRGAAERRRDGDVVVRMRGAGA